MLLVQLISLKRSEMAFTQFLSALRDDLSPQAQVLTDPTNESFKQALQRWSDIEVKVPGAIVQIGSEKDAVKTASSIQIPQACAVRPDNTMIR